jgi:hypothetical protein
MLPRLLSHDPANLDQNLPSSCHTLPWSSSFHQFQIVFVEELVRIQRSTDSRYTLLEFQLSLFVVQA